MSKPEDKHYTAINFKNVPTKPDVDVDFSISCSVNAKMNLTYRHASKEGKKEDIVLSEKNCSNFKYRFSKGDYTFGNEENTTFYVYVYDFQPPLWIIISFSQHPKLDLLQFFITFSTCFLALLLIAAILWKIKQKYDRYRRRQRLYVEMEQMASRPFGQVCSLVFSTISIFGSNAQFSIMSYTTTISLKRQQCPVLHHVLHNNIS